MFVNLFWDALLFTDGCLEQGIVRDCVHIIIYTYIHNPRKAQYVVYVVNGIGIIYVTMESTGK